FMNTQKDEFVAISQRTDLQIVNKTANFQSVINDALLSTGRLHGPSGTDFICYKLNDQHHPIIKRMPPFLSGIYRWDNWLLSEFLLTTNVTVVI
ncbi:unnamed protein product, partial [Didymodactylos carnosus]